MNNSMNNLQLFTLIGLSTLVVICFLLIILEKNWENPKIGIIGMIGIFVTALFGFVLIGFLPRYRETKEEVTLELGHSHSKVFGIRNGETVFESSDYLTVIKTKDQDTAKFVVTTYYNLYNSQHDCKPKYELAN